MMYSYDAQMGEIHALMAWCSVLLFLVRGLAFQLDFAWGSDSRLLILAVGLNVLLAVTGFSLWVLLYLNPVRDSWLLAKLLALTIYAPCAHWAMVQARFHMLGYLIALLMLIYIMGVSITRSPWLGLA